MNVGLHIDAKLPVGAYGGTERVVWGLACALIRAGHKVTLFARKGSFLPGGNVVAIDEGKSLSDLIPDDIEIMHFQNGVDASYLERAGKTLPPYVVTIHGNMASGQTPLPNSIFVSRNHAERHGSGRYVYNGLEWSDYPEFEPGKRRENLFFLANAAWKVKNLKGAMQIARLAGRRLDVLGGHRLNLKMGFRLTLDPKVRFYGMVGNERKAEVAGRSRGLLFPVLWDEPFGLAVVEAIYYGSPVFATPRGSLPELVIPGMGFLSEDYKELAEAAKNFRGDEQLIHRYAEENFNSDVMAANYLKYYQQAIKEANR